MAKQPVVGLGDVSFDPSLQTDEVDHDFFDNPASLPEPDVQVPNVELETDSALKIGFPLAPIRIVTDSPPHCPDSNEIFSTGTLLACLNNPPRELTIEVNGSQLDYNSFRRNCSENVNSPKNERNKKSRRQPRIKLFDISDSSSDESGSDASDEELNNFMEKYYDLLDVEDTDNSDITEVSPMSSLTVSPLPAFGGEGSGAEDSLDGSSNNKYSGSLINFRSISGTEFASNGVEKSEHESNGENLPTIIPTIRQPLVIGTRDEVSSNSFSGLFSENKDQNQNGDRSPSDSSCVSDCGSTNNSCSSSISFNVSPKRSCCSSSTSSSCGSMGPRKSGRNFTFTPDQLKRIERENGILLKKILDVQRHSHHHLHHLHNHGSHRGSHKNSAYRNMQCAATIARQKQQRKIDHDNLMLMKRLQTAKPSREIGEAFKTKNA